MRMYLQALACVSVRVSVCITYVCVGLWDCVCAMPPPKLVYSSVLPMCVVPACVSSRVAHGRRAHFCPGEKKISKEASRYFKEGIEEREEWKRRKRATGSISSSKDTRQDHLAIGQTEAV